MKAFDIILIDSNNTKKEINIVLFSWTNLKWVYSVIQQNKEAISIKWLFKYFLL